MVSSQPLKIAVVAGEASGDLLGGYLIEALKKRLPNAQFVGVGGPLMQRHGLQSLFDMQTLSVMGYVEVLKKLPSLLAMRRQLKRQLVQMRPDVMIGIDAPDFNLALEQHCKQAGIATLHYVSPSVWAWRYKRIYRIQKSADAVLCLFPFEPAIYQKIGMPSTYVGHPLADAIPLQPDMRALRQQYKYPQTQKIFALLPGSRLSEVDRLAPILIETARLILQEYPDARFLVPLINQTTRQCFLQHIYTQEAQDLPIEVMFGHASAAMLAADAVVVASGTASLEAALLKKPMVIIYKVAPLTYRLMRRKALLPYVGLPNILAGEFIVPELIQDDAEPHKIVRALLSQLADPIHLKSLQEKLLHIHHQLRQNNAERAADAVIAHLKAKARL